MCCLPPCGVVVRIVWGRNMKESERQCAYFVLMNIQADTGIYCELHAARFCQSKVMEGFFPFLTCRFFSDFAVYV